jgi:hypothetical protein
MTDRAYTEAKVIGDINCSSSADHFIDVKLLKRGVWHKYAYYFEGGSFIGKRGWDIQIPGYARRMVDEAILADLKAGARVFEYDRDGNKRYDELRYHESDWVARRIAQLEAELKGET